MRWLILLGLGFSTVAMGERLAIVVGNNVGATERARLRFSELDASRVAGVLEELGEVPPENIVLLTGGTKGDLDKAFASTRSRIRSLRQNPAARVVLFFYFSGHSDGEALELGKERFSFATLRQALEASGADLRVGIIDSCKSGALLALKGGSAMPPFEIRLTDELATSGQAFLTSSAADEMALESRDLKGSFFTHNIVLGLRGAADASGNGQVTLSEIYQYAFSRTVKATMATLLGAQHPAYAYQLSGKGDLVITEPGRRNGFVILPEGFERATLVDLKTPEYLLEVPTGASHRVALQPGRYELQLIRDKRAWTRELEVAQGEAREVTWEELKPNPVRPYPVKAAASAWALFSGFGLGMGFEALWVQLSKRGFSHYAEIGVPALDGRPMALDALVRDLLAYQEKGQSVCAITTLPADLPSKFRPIRRLACTSPAKDPLMRGLLFHLFEEAVFSMEFQFTPEIGVDAYQGVIGKLGTDFSTTTDAPAEAMLLDAYVRDACQGLGCRVVTWDRDELGMEAWAVVTRKGSIVSLRLTDRPRQNLADQDVKRIRLQSAQEATRRLGF